MVFNPTAATPAPHPSPGAAGATGVKPRMNSKGVDFDMNIIRSMNSKGVDFHMNVQFFSTSTAPPSSTTSPVSPLKSPSTPLPLPALPAPARGRGASPSVISLTGPSSPPRLSHVPPPRRRTGSGLLLTRTETPTTLSSSRQSLDHTMVNTYSHYPAPPGQGSAVPPPLRPPNGVYERVGFVPSSPSRGYSEYAEMRDVVVQPPDSPLSVDLGSPRQNGDVSFSSEYEEDQYLDTCKGRVYRVLTSPPFQVFLIFLLIGDLVVLAVSYWAEAERDNLVKPLHIVTFTDACVFLAEAMLRAWSMGWNAFFNGRGKWMQRFEFTVLTACVVTELVTLMDDYGEVVRSVSPALLFLLRILRVCRFCRSIIVAMEVVRGSSHAARSGVSGNRRRHVTAKYDLDLSYVTPRIIAMSWPGQGTEEFYRNPLYMVASFLRERHPDGFMVYNLCRERRYDAEKFDGRVQRFKMDDHNATDLHMLVDFCRSADEWVQESPGNVIVVHCKAGKGRTGTCICSYLMYSGAAATASEAMAIFARARAGKGFSGVQSPSQERYLRYFETWMTKLGRQMPTSRWRVTRIVMNGLPSNVLHKLSKLWLVLLGGGSQQVLWTSTGAPITIDDTEERVNADDVKRIKKIIPPPPTPTGDEQYTAEVSYKSNVTPYTAKQYYAYFEHAKTTPKGTVSLVYDSGGMPFVSGDLRFHWFFEETTTHVPVKSSRWWFWVNVSMLETTTTQSTCKVTLPREKIDGAHKKKHAKKYSADFSVTVHFERQ